MLLCNMQSIPPPSAKEWYRCSGDCECAICGQLYLAHPLDWLDLGYDDRPYLRVLCNGDRVKL